MIKNYWSKLFTDWREAKMVVLEWDKERRGIIESDETWDLIILTMFEIDNNVVHSEKEKISMLMKFVGREMYLPLVSLRHSELAKYIVITKDKINYYTNNPEEE